MKTRTRESFSAVLPRSLRVLVLFCLTIGLATGALAQSAVIQHPLMYFTPDQIADIANRHAQTLPLEAVLPSVDELAPQTFPASMSLLSYLPYVPSERDQGGCGDCWAWAGTGCMEIAHNLQNGVAQRLSVQLLNTCNPYVSCCDGGWLDNVAQFYSYEGFAVPWTNSNASWSSGDGSCGAACGTIATNTRYAITNIAVNSIVTTGVGQAAAIANIKTALNNNQPVWFGFFMGSDADWNKFDSFWESQSETVQWTNFNPGEAYTTGAGHAIMCVGYDDNAAGGPAWIMLNQWGTTSGRPDGTLLVSQDIDYDGDVMMGSSPYQQLYFETLTVGFQSQTTNTLTIDINGSGSVQYAGSNAPSTISVLNGSTVGLTAVGNFLGWSGGATGASATENILLTSNLTVTANFADGTNSLAPIIAAQPQAESVAVGGTINLSVSGYGIPAPAYSWSFGGQPVGNGTSNLVITNVSGVNQGNYTCTLSNSAGQIQSSSALVTVEGGPAFTQQPTSQVVIPGGTATFTSLANSTNVTYQWYTASNAVTHGTNASLVIANAQTANAGSYYVVITNAAIAESATSSIVTLTVVSRPAITAQPLSTNVGLGTNVTLSVTATGGGLSYTWKKGSTILQSGTNDTYAVNTSVSASSTYTVVVANLAGSVTSLGATVLVAGPPVIVSMPVNKYIGVGSNLSLAITCTNIGGTFTWLFNSNVLTSCTNNVLAIDNVTSNSTGLYSLVLSNMAGTVQSNVTLSVMVPPSILVQPPASTMLPAGTNVQLAATAAGSSLVYQWSKNAVPISGATNATLSLSNLAAIHSGSYTLLVTNQIGTAVTHASALSVVSIPLITNLPAKYLSTSNNWTITFPCTNVAGTFTWYFNGTNLLSSTTNSLALTNVTTNQTGLYSLVLSNVAGVVTGSVNIYVYYAPTITGQPAASTVEPLGGTAQFLVTAYGSHMSYQWSKNGKVVSNGTNVTGATAQLLTINSLTAANAGTYSLLITNQVGRVTSHGAVLTVIMPPVFTAKPKSQSLIVNQPLKFIVLAAGTKPYTNLAYQWLFAGTNIANATNSTFSIANITTNWAGTFTVQVSNFGGTNSASATVTVLPDTSPPRLTITAPTKPFTNSPCAISGTGHDLVGITNLTFSLDGGQTFSNATTANGWTNWTASVPAAVGTNTVMFVATDVNGLSATNSVKFKYMPFFSASVTIAGGGSGTAFGWVSQMQYGSTYTITAKAAAQNFFMHWSDLNGVITSSSTNSTRISFIVTNNVSATLWIATNNFYADTGSFNGLFYQSNAVTLDTAGFLHLALTTNLDYSGKVLFDGQSITVSGQFDTNGNASIPLTPSVTMACALTNNQIVGTVNGSDWTANLTADLAQFSTANPATDFAGAYDIVIPPDTNGTASGYGFGSVSVSTAGTITFVGTAGDGTSLSQTVPVSSEGYWPLFVQMYTYNKTNTAGALMGWVSFPTNGAPTGNVTWIKTPYNNLSPYAAGLTNNTAILSSTYTAPTKASPLTLPGFTNGDVTFTGGDLASNIVNQITQTNNGTIYSFSKSMAMHFSSGGLFSGTFFDNGTGTTKTFYGAVLQNSTNGFGYFPTFTQTGPVSLTPAP